MKLLDIIKKKGWFLLVLVSFFNISLLCSQIYASTENFNYSLEFSDNSKLTLAAKNVPLGLLLEDIQKETGLKLKIHEDHVNQLVSVNFKLLSLEQGIKRILKGINYICLFRSDQKVEKITTISSPPRKTHLSEDTLDRKVPSHKIERIMPPPEIADMEIAMGVKPPHKTEDLETAMEIKPPPVTEDMEVAMGVIPPPENLHILEVMEIEPPPE